MDWSLSDQSIDCYYPKRQQEFILSSVDTKVWAENHVCVVVPGSLLLSSPGTNAGMFLYKHESVYKLSLKPGWQHNLIFDGASNESLSTLF